MGGSEEPIDFRDGRTRILARPDALEHVRALIALHGSLHGAAEAESAGTFQGRGTPHLLATPAGDWVVRHYRRGGLVGRVIHDRYARVGGARPVRELRVSDAARARGVPTPRVMAAVVEQGRLSYRGDLAVELVPGAPDLAAVLFGSRAPGESGSGTVAGFHAMAAAGRLIRLLHERGVIHPDLNLKNILVRPGEVGVEALVVDLDRSRVVDRVRARARRRMLERFLRSVRRWEDRTGVRLAPGAAAAFETGYADGGAG